MPMFFVCAGTLINSANMSVGTKCLLPSLLLEEHSDI